MTVGDLQSIEDVYLRELKTMCGAYIDLIAAEEKRRREGGLR